MDKNDFKVLMEKINQAAEIIYSMANDSDINSIDYLIKKASPFHEEIFFIELQSRIFSIADKYGLRGHVEKVLLY